MDDEEFDRLAEALNKVNRSQVHTMGMLAKIQAQMLVLESLVAAMQVNAGCDMEEVRKTKADLYDRFEALTQDALKNWLAKNGVIALPGDDEWWDKPS